MPSLLPEPSNQSTPAFPMFHRLVTAVSCVVILVALYLIFFLDRSAPIPSPAARLDIFKVSDAPSPNPAPTKIFETIIRQPAGPPRVHTGAFDAHGQPVTAACNTCHTTRPPNLDLKVGMELKTFHQGLKGAHGSMTCVSCHNPNDGYKSLRLADGTSVRFQDVMKLCAQCHGPQYRDYQNGAHGGMTGYWDLTKGGRVRNNCIDCHDPHSPKYPTVRPAPGPIDKIPNPTRSHP